MDKRMLPISDVNTVDEDGFTVLHMAALDGFSKIVKALLPMSNVLAETNSERIAVDLAIEEGHPSCVSLLAPLCSPWTQRKVEHRSYADPLNSAVWNNHPDIVDFLLSMDEERCASPQDWVDLANNVERNACIERAVIRAESPFWSPRNLCARILKEHSARVAAKKEAAAIFAHISQFNPTADSIASRASSL
jgi:hypothetical protein